MSRPLTTHPPHPPTGIVVLSLPTVLFFTLPALTCAFALSHPLVYYLLILGAATHSQTLAPTLRSSKTAALPAIFSRTGRVTAHAVPNCRWSWWSRSRAMRCCITRCFCLESFYK